MLTQKEVNTLNLSTTKKDFVQIWNELLEVAGKLSERWDPTSTNESDPGIVILKALTGIADRLNYNIDKNTLEAFMPTAAQEESMRKLCEMLGYNIKYYRSAVADVTIKYHKADVDEEEPEILRTGLVIPKFTVITNGDQDINYFTINSDLPRISSGSPSVTVPCMEGQIVKCESINDNNVITANQVLENNRYYFPETQIAENGIFIYNVNSINNSISQGLTLTEGERWEQVDNLNIQKQGTKVYKFGFDSYEERPYVEFPEDYSNLFNEGIFIYYTRTSGLAGSISPGTLTKLEAPSHEDWQEVASDNFSVTNIFASTPGANIETIKQAYNNFKKTVGTFETLVTCRDYMNKIYTMIDSYGKPLVSNVLVTDIRNDLNRAVTICSWDDAGIFYKETPLFESAENEQPKIDHFSLVIYPFKSYNQIKNNVKDISELYNSSFKLKYASEKNLLKTRLENDRLRTLAHKFVFPQENDLISINNYLKLDAIIATNSKITAEEGNVIIDRIKIALANAFNMRELDFGEEIPFESLVEVIENADSRIKLVSLNEPALYTTFSVLSSTDNNSTPVIQEYAVASKNYTEADAKASGCIDTFDTDEARRIYNDLVVRNILAGRVPLFKFNNTFNTSFSESAFQITQEVDESSIANNIKNALNADGTGSFCVIVDDDTNTTYTRQNGKYTKTSVPTVTVDTEGSAEDPKTIPFGLITALPLDNESLPITSISTKCEIQADSAGNIENLKLAPGEFIKFRAPNFKTVKTYPAYVNYYLELANNGQPSNGNETAAVCAEAWSLQELLFGNNPNQDTKADKTFKTFSTNNDILKTAELSQDVKKPVENNGGTITITPSSPSVESITDTLKSCGCIKVCKDKIITSDDLPGIELEKDFYITDVQQLEDLTGLIDSALATALGDNNIEVEGTITLELQYLSFDNLDTNTTWKTFIESQDGVSLLGFTPVVEGSTLFWQVYGTDYNKGKYILSSGSKLLPYDSEQASDTTKSIPTHIYLVKSLGSDSVPLKLETDAEYMLKNGESLFIEYTPASTNEDGTTKKTSPITEVYGEGTIIKPGGFENGLIASAALRRQGISPSKTVYFKEQDRPIEMMHLGVNEQIEIRDFAQVVFSNSENTFNSTLPVVNVYKNFNGCDELETGKGNSREYTLKDGEYIFYTDADKTEFAYVSTGTKVTLSGNIVLDTFEVIDLSTILDEGISAIPRWQKLNFNSEADSVTFTEYQYITLGADDTLNELTLSNPPTLDNTWQFCSNVSYTVAGETSPSYLPAVNLNDSEGWEVCSVLELNVSPSNAQTLRSNDQIQTSLTLSSAYSESGSGKRANITISPSQTALSPSSGDQRAARAVGNREEATLAFQTNLACQTSRTSIDFNDLPFKASHSGFEFKLFTKNAPSIVETELDKLTPVNLSSDFDINTWFGTTDEIRELANSWHQVSLDKINQGQENSKDRALCLPINLLPSTYGIFSIYVRPTTEESSIWIESFASTSSNSSISLLNNNTNEESTNETRIYLSTGLNCIKIAKSGKYFVKASCGTKGVLLFDTLKLVDCSKSSNGLNLDQLGYLPLSSIAGTETVSAEVTSPNNLDALEIQLLDNIRKFDVGNDFYYTVSIEPDLAIEFNEGNSEFNTLKNPIFNYDINNINNNFVISKIDIDYLDRGIKIAQSSRLS